jgi:hypothetical protein
MAFRAAMVLTAACAGNETTPDDEACVEPDVGLWCFHSEADGGPVVPDTGNATCDPPSADGARPCDPYVVVFSGAGATGQNHYFLDGVHVSTQYWTDTPYSCGAAEYWYGEVIENCR